MKIKHIKSVLLGTFAIGLLAFSGSTYALGENACKNEVGLKFSNVPRAGISVSRSVPMKHREARIDWSVNWENTMARGFCKVNAGGNVVRLKTNTHKVYRNNSVNEQDGYYYDEHTRKWRDPSGRTCHTCTPATGFPNHAKNEHRGKE